MSNYKNDFLPVVEWPTQRQSFDLFSLQMFGQCSECSCNRRQNVDFTLNYDVNIQQYILVTIEPKSTKQTGWTLRLNGITMTECEQFNQYEVIKNKNLFSFCAISFLSELHG